METRIGSCGKREYVKRWKVTPRPREEWIAVPVPESGIPREWVDAARETTKYNQHTVSRGQPVRELGGCIARCGGCACEGRNRPADEVEAEVWGSLASNSLRPRAATRRPGHNNRGGVPVISE